MAKNRMRVAVPVAETLWASPRRTRVGSPILQGLGSQTDRSDQIQEAAGRNRRALNIAMASLSLIITIPLFLLAAVLVKLSSRGPVIYSQERVGLERRRRNGDSFKRAIPDRRNSNAGGKIFRMYKFRTMYENGNRSARKQVWASRNDPRITPVGRVLRAFRLDELPQMVNVLLGDMNIVGPRPEQPEIFKELRKELKDYPRRQHVLPGITGLAQVNHGYDQCLQDVKRKLSWDLDYIERNSSTEDLKIMLKTVPVVLFRKGSL